MSLSRAELKAMDRDELVETIVGLADDVDDQQARLDAMSTWNETITERLDDLEAENEQLRNRVGRLENEIEAIRDLGSERTSKEEKIAQVVIYAENEVSQSQSKTTVLPKTIKGVAGVSRRYAYDLVEDMIDTYDWALDPQQQHRRVDQDTPQKGVLIDLERLHNDPEAVNKFTTGVGSNGGAE